MRAARTLLPLVLCLLSTATAAQSELCRVYPPGPPHGGCGACGGPGVRLDSGRCARWNDVVVPDCRALRGELRDPARCAADRQRERGKPITNPSRP
jgi:hypothetical protein